MILPRIIRWEGRIWVKKLLEFRWHGRGGQGAWTASELLARAALSEGKYIQSFPEFGPGENGGTGDCLHTHKH